jgi:uncharacterized membrane protein
MVFALGFGVFHAEKSDAKIRSHSSYHSGSSYSSYDAPSSKYSSKYSSYSYSKPKKKGFFGKVGSFFKGIFIVGIILVVLFIIIVIVGAVFLRKYLRHRRRH